MFCAGMVRATASTLRHSPHQGKIPRQHQTALRGQANVCSHTATALLPNLSLWGEFWETQRPRNLSVPRAGQAKRRARSPKSSVLFAGSIRRGIETATNSSSATSNASAQFFACSARGQPRQAPRVRKSSVTGMTANPSVGGRAYGTRESLRDRVPDRDPPVVLALMRLSSANSSPCRAEVGSTAIHDRHLRANRLMFFATIDLSRETPLRIERLLLAQEVIDRAADLRFEYR